MKLSKPSALIYKFQYNYIEVLPAASVNIIDVTEDIGVHMACIEAREIRKHQRADPIIGKWVRAVIDKN